MRYLIGLRQYFGLKDNEIKRLLKTIKTRAIAFKIIMVGTVLTGILLQTTGMGFMFCKNPPTRTAANALYAISYLIFPSLATTITAIHFFTFYLAYIIMTGCLTARINSVMNRLQVRREESKDQSKLLTEAESIFKTVKDYNKTQVFLSKT